MEYNGIIAPVTRVLLFPRERGGGAAEVVAQACQWLLARDVSVVIPEHIAADPHFQPLAGVEVLAEDAQPDADIGLVVALGGDGTLLRAARLGADQDIPVVGVNLGDLGFLAAAPREQLLSVLEAAVDGLLTWQARLRMKVELWRDGKLETSQVACNDAYIKHGVIPRLLRLATYVGPQFMATYAADGLIVCTPMGSTAYNLAAGGPLMEPTLHALTITPMCPHSLTLRPVVCSAHLEIRIVYVGPDEHSSAFLTVDGQAVIELAVHDEVRITACDRPMRLVPPHSSVFQVLAAKLGWSDAGVDSSRRPRENS